MIYLSLNGVSSKKESNMENCVIEQIQNQGCIKSTSIVHCKLNECKLYCMCRDINASNNIMYLLTLQNVK